MKAPIGMLHFADTHIGMENYGRVDPETGTSSRVRDFLDRLDEAIDYALEREVDLAVFAGDAFRNREPNPTHQREFAARIKRLADAAPILLLLGNHDMPAMTSKASTVDIFRALAVPNVMVGHQPGGQVVETKRGPVYLAWMPYPMRNHLLNPDTCRGKSIEQLEGILRQTVSETLRDLAQRAEGQAMPRVLAGHFSVAEAELGSERTVMLGRDVMVNRSTLAEPVWDYVALGHIHRHQVVNPGESPPMVYSGSLERIDFGEEGEEKGFCWVKLARGEADWTFVPVAARPFQTYRVDARDSEDPTEATIGRLIDVAEGAVVRIIVRLRAEQEAAFQERVVLQELERASSVTISREVEVEARTRLGDVAPQALGARELLSRYFQAREVEPDRREALMERAEGLLEAP